MKKSITLSGNGNISFENFLHHYKPVLDKCLIDGFKFNIGDFRGTDCLIMEYLKTQTPDVTIWLCNKSNPSYIPDHFKTFACEWKIMQSGETTSQNRDFQMIDNSDYFFGVDFNSDEFRKSGTLKNIEKAIRENKMYKV